MVGPIIFALDALLDGSTLPRGVDKSPSKEGLLLAGRSAKAIALNKAVKNLGAVTQA